MSASYPGAAKTFTSRSAGQVIASAHINDLQDEVNAVEVNVIGALATAYGVVLAGTTTTGPLQNAGAGTAGQMLVSAGASAKPAFSGTPILAGDILGTFTLKGSAAIFNYVGGSTTGTVNDWAPGLVANTLFVMSSASDLTVTGIAGGYAGQMIAFINNGSGGNLFFAYNSGSSAASNVFINAVTVGATPVGAGGWILYFHNGTNWRLIGHNQGAWITRTFAAGNYTASAGNWTVAAAVRDAYLVNGRSLTYSFSATGTTSGTPVSVKIALPYTTTALENAAIYNKNPGTGAGEGGYAATVAAGATVNCQRFNDVAYAAGTVHVVGEIQAMLT